MKYDLNDGIVAILDKIVNLIHLMAGLAVVIGNFYCMKALTHSWEFPKFLCFHMAVTVIAILIYVLLMGVIATFISINRNLQRLVALQSGASETPRREATGVTRAWIEEARSDTRPLQVILIWVFAIGLVLFIWIFLFFSGALS